MGETGAFVAGLAVGSVSGGSLGYQAGYDKRNEELQPYIASLQRTIQMRDQRIAELERLLKESTTRIPVLSQVRKKLTGSQ